MQPFAVAAFVMHGWPAAVALVVLVALTAKKKQQQQHASHASQKQQQLTAAFSDVRLSILAVKAYPLDCH